MAFHSREGWESRGGFGLRWTLWLVRWSLRRPGSVTIGRKVFRCGKKERGENCYQNLLCSLQRVQSCFQWEYRWAVLPAFPSEPTEQRLENYNSLQML